MATWVNLNRAAKFPEVVKVYKRAGRGQGSGQSGYGGTTPASSVLGFLTYVKRLASESNGASLPAWIRKVPLTGNSGIANDWQDLQVDVTAIPGVRPLRTNGKWVSF